MFYQWDFAFLLRYTPLFWKGVLVTLAYTVATILLGLIIGLLIGLGRLSRSKLLNIPLIAFIEAFRCTPLLVQIVWFYYALPVLLNIQIPATTAAVLVLSCYTGAFYAEIFRGGIVSIERGQWDAARALGLSYPHQLRLVIIPQAIKIASPPTVGIMVQLLKGTSLASIIGFAELTRAAQMVNNATFRPLTVYAIVAMLYFALCWPLSLLGQHMERRLNLEHLPVVKLQA